MTAISSARPRVRPGRPRRPAAVLGAAALGAAALLGAVTAAGPADHRARPGLDSAAAVGLRLTTTRSHAGEYTIALIAVEGAVAARKPQRWTVRLQDAHGAPVDRATLRVSAWRPDDAGAPALTLPGVAGGRRGEYVIGPLVLPRAGWWNLPIRIERDGSADSLAFNLVLPPEVQGS